MDRNALAELLQALESRRDAEERRREERYTALIERLLYLTIAIVVPHAVCIATEVHFGKCDYQVTANLRKNHRAKTMENKRLAPAPLGPMGNFIQFKKGSPHRI
ncbi:UNVERIFIED_CONTAM: hypothetical protein FKN15_013280 [Acipenser sinensis]